MKPKTKGIDVCAELEKQAGKRKSVGKWLTGKKKKIKKEGENK